MFYEFIFPYHTYDIRFSVTVCESTHTAHDTENVVVDGVDSDLGRLVVANGVVGQSQAQGSIVDTRHVAAAAGLVVLRVEGEGVDIDTNGRDVGVVLEGLHQVEVLTLTLAETVMAVQLDLANNCWVLAGQALNRGDRVARLESRTVEPIGVVEGLLSLVHIHGAIARHEGITLDNPDELLARVVERHLDFVE